MHHPARTTTSLWKRLGLQARPRRGARPHCLPVNVELLMPLVGNSLLLPAMMNPLFTIVSVAASYLYREGSKLYIRPYFSLRPPWSSKRRPTVTLRLGRSCNLS